MIAAAGDGFDIRGFGTAGVLFICGTHAHFDVTGEVDILTRTLGKALGGAIGGYIAG